MYGYLGQIFDTFEQFLQYLNTTYGSGAQAQLQSITQWGQDLGGNPLFINGVQQYGTVGNGLIEAGYQSAEVYLNGTASATSQTVIEPSFSQLAEYLRQASVSFDGIDMSNVQIVAGETIDNVAQTIPGLNQSMVSGNGTVSNIPSVMTAEETTGGFLGTLATVGYISLPTAVAAAAPLLGVAFGYGLYEANPDFWEVVSQKVAPHVWQKSDEITEWLVNIVNKVEQGVTTPMMSSEFLESLREAFLELGVYDQEEVFPEAHPQGTQVTITSNMSVRNLFNYVISNYPVYSNYDFASIYQQIESFFNTYDPDGTAVGEVTFYDTTSSYGGYSPVTISIYRNLHVGDTIVLGQTTFVKDYLSMAANKTAGINQTFHFYQAQVNTLNNQVVYDGIYTESTSSSLNVSARSINVTSSEPVEGVSLDPNATYPTDTTKNLAELFPSWTANGISVITNPLADNLADGTTDYYPFSFSDTVNTTNPDNVATDKTQQEAQQAQNTDPAQENQIAQAIKDLIDELTEDGTLPPNPTVPSDPSGNTPTPTPPVITGAGSDLIAIYNPTKAEIQAFNAFLWSLDPTNLTNWKKVIANPIDAIISLAMIYVTPITGSPQHIKCGYIETDVSSKIVTNQYVDIDCGTVRINEYFNNVWDYEATRISIYLPFIGIVPLHVGDVMDSTIRVRYRVDVYTGTCLAQIIVLKGNSLATLYTYTGNCSVQLPLTSGSFSGVFSTLLSMGSTALTGNLVGAAGVGIGSALTGRVQQDIQRSGNIGSNAGAMGIRTPYVIITRNVPLDAYLYQNQYGFPANKTVTLGDMHGYTRVKTIHLTGISCTDDELEEIERLLKEGVIIN